MNNFNQMNFHDSTILEILLDKKEERITRVVIKLAYIIDYTNINAAPKRLIFQNCYKIMMDINAGIVAPESIREGYEVENSEIIDSFKNQFVKTGIPLPILKHFHILTAATSSNIDILAEWVELVDD
jgi:hypothetical protein